MGKIFILTEKKIVINDVITTDIIPTETGVYWLMKVTLLEKWVLCTSRCSYSKYSWTLDLLAFFVGTIAIILYSLTTRTLGIVLGEMCIFIGVIHMERRGFRRVISRYKERQRDIQNEKD